MTLGGFAVCGMTVVPVSAQDATFDDLKQAAPARQVQGIGYCRGNCEVKLGDGSTRLFKERDLRFGTDSSPLGPVAGRGVLVPTGRVGDRALVIFADAEEIKTFIRKTC